MSGLLTDLMRERGDALEQFDLDVLGIVREGDKRVRRRRAVVVSGAAALAAVTVLVAPALMGDGDPRTAGDPNRAATSTDREVTYAEGSQLTTDGATVDVGHEVVTLVETDVGVVFADADRAVWSYVDGQASEVGHLVDDWRELVSDGHWVAWLDAEAGPEGEFAVLDQASGEVVRDPLAGVVHPPDRIIDEDDMIATSRYYALDGPVAYLRDAAGIQAWNTATGDVRLLSTDPRLIIIDVEGGTIVSQLPANTPDRYIWVGETVGAGLEIDAHSVSDLSPNGRYLLGSSKPRDTTIFDTRTGQALPRHVQLDGYDFVAGHEWLDDQHYLAFGHHRDDRQEPVDLVSCAVETGACATVVEDIGRGFALASGQAAS